MYSFGKRLFRAECQANAMDCDFTCSPHPFSWEAFCDFSEDGRPHVHLTVSLSLNQIFFFRNLHALYPFQNLISTNFTLFYTFSVSGITGPFPTSYIQVVQYSKQ